MMIKRMICAGVALVVAGCGSDGPVREPAELVSIGEPAIKGKVLWRRSPGSGDRRPPGLRLAVEDDAVFLGDPDGRVFALDLANGKTLWSVDTGKRLAAGPTVDGGLIVVGTLDAEVLALSRSDGKLLWETVLSSEVLAPPAVSGNTVIVRCGDGKLFGLDSAGGSQRWNFDRGVPPLTLRGLSPPKVEGPLVLAGLDNGRAVALRTDDGAVLWEQVVAAPSGRSELERIVDIDGDLLVAGGGLFGVSFGGELAAINIEDGRVAWRRPIKSYNGPADGGALIAVTDESGVVWALDGASGAAAWTQEAFKYRRLSPPAVHRGYFAVADFEGYLHWLSTQDGQVVGRVRPLDEPVTAPMVERDGVLYLVDAEGRVAAVATAGS